MDGEIMQLTYDQLLNIMGQYDSEGGRSLPPDIAQWLASQPSAEQPSMMGGGADRVYDFEQYNNEYGSAPIGPDGRPMFEPAQGWGGGMQSLRNAVGVLGGSALLGNFAMPMLAGGAPAAAPAGAASGAGLTAGSGGSTGLLTGAGGATGMTAPAVAGGTGAGMATTGAGMATLSGIGSLLGQNANWLLPAAGALAGAADNGQESRTSGLPDWMQPAAQQYVQTAQRLSQTPFTPYPGQGVAPMNPDQQAAMSQARTLAMQGDPSVNAARAQQANVIGGGMLNSNPYIDRVAQGIGDRMGEAYATGTRGRLTAGFQQSGNDPRYSSAYEQTVGNTDRAFADSVGQTMAGLYGDNYRQERGAQDLASRFSPQFASDMRTNTEGLLSAGNQQQQQQQNVNNFDYGQFQQQQQYPFKMNEQLGSAINPAFGQTTTTNDGVPWWARALGGGTAGYAASRSMYPQPQQQASAPFPAYFNQPT
jgi:hypothetical protein